MLTELKTKVVQMSAQIGLKINHLEALIEVPKHLGHGQLSLPVFSLAKERRKAPHQIAIELAQQFTNLNNPDFLKIVALSGYVNFHFRNDLIQNLLFSTISRDREQLGHGNLGQNQTLVIDFSSPNVAKPMHIGHLRATVIGQAIVNLAKNQNFKVIGLNHLGDWGVQFGNVAWAYQNWGKEYPFDEKPFQSLYQLYVRFHQEAENNAEIAKAGSDTFVKLESGDPEITSLWKMIVSISMTEYERIWNLLGVRHELIRGESFYNNRLEEVTRELEEKKLLVESEGAMVVNLDVEGMNPCLIRKKDGASLYATRDLASALYRMNELKANINLYVVGMEQTLHFRQVFAVLRRMGYEWVDQCHHISFGMYQFKDVGKMSSRKGQIVLLEDVLGRAIEMVEKIITEKNPALPDREKIAQQIGIGAIIFNDLINDRVKNVEFDWDRVLDLNGDSGPYVQYCHVRCSSLLKKYDHPVHFQNLSTFSITELKEVEEVELIRRLIEFPDVALAAFKQFKPHFVASYLLEICRLFNQFYAKYRILGEDKNLEKTRMALVFATQQILERGLKILNIPTVSAM